MKLLALFALVLIFAGWSDASHAVRALECADCSAQQEEDTVKRLGGNGYFFVYNLQQARVRKFLTYLTADDGLAVRESGPRGTGGVEVTRYAATPEGDIGERLGNAKAVGWVRVLEEYPVDADVAQIFTAILDVERAAPGVIRGLQRAHVPIGNVGQVPGNLGPRNYDPRLAAWDYPNAGEFNSFVERMGEMLSTKDSANRLNPTLGKILFGVHAQSKSVNVSVGSGGVSLGVQWERLGPKTLIKVCDDQGNCVHMTLASDGENVYAQFEKVVDASNTTLPAETIPLNVRWTERGSQSAAEYAAWLQRLYRGNTLNIVGGSSGCGTRILACTAIPDTTLLACQLSCQ
jgi:hypothetical protein